MTPARQPPEGGITCSGCRKDVRSGYFFCDDCYATLTIAPAPSTVVEDITFEGAAIVQAARAEAAKAAREQVLDDLVYWMYDCPFGGREGSDGCHTILAHKIESLRAQQEPQQEGVSEV